MWLPVGESVILITYVLFGLINVLITGQIGAVVFLRGHFYMITGLC